MKTGDTGTDRWGALNNPNTNETNNGTRPKSDISFQYTLPLKIVVSEIKEIALT